MVHHNQKSNSTIKTKPTNAPIIILPPESSSSDTDTRHISVSHRLRHRQYPVQRPNFVKNFNTANNERHERNKYEKKTAGEGMYVNQAYEMSDFRSYPAICYPISFHSHTSTPPSLHFVMCQNQDLWGVYTHMNVMWCDARMVSVYVYIHRVIKCYIKSLKSWDDNGEAFHPPQLCHCIIALCEVTESGSVGVIYSHKCVTLDVIDVIMWCQNGVCNTPVRCSI